ncbi:related to TOK1 - Voltage-gated, outward-rectifying K+ channel protein of the plasma membrane [Ustilago trichophora]|uniref:Related to TOK1 - Voltage-gated, outward-rectifying K+ channel protein of the plasma membrane n=1 Tax=Ustilago trichophora TaxID=86804 RepID=A0A5C3EA27_9BASI|nr:related to TOK1 - Voltage-gated, outward-rectifying K+ channel protein of the plasma membrane [Ustilago trichophora]
MNNTGAHSRENELPERPALLPSAASLRPTHITSRLPPLKSLQTSNHTSSRARSPFPSRKDDLPPASSTKAFPTTNTLQTFLTVTDVPHYGHANHLSDAPNSGSAPHSTAQTHNWRVRKTPIFSGLVAPFSIVLEIPGLTSKWYAKIDENGIVERFIDNPTILTVGLAISLSAAVVANAVIILRFLEVLRPRQSIALAIAGFGLHDLINVVALATFGGIYGPKHDGLSLSASYWMVCASTITSTLVTISLIADYVRTKDFRHAGSGLTQLQKGLVLAGMGLLLYLSLGSLIFVFVIQIDFITALYFSTATVLTVGFGDVVPASPGGKVLVILYAPIGIVLVALVVSSARNTILETFQAALLARTKERRRRIAERKTAHKELKRQGRALRRAMPRTFTFGPGAGAAGNHTDDGNDFAEALAQMEKQAAEHHVENDSPAGSGVTAESVDTIAAITSDNTADTIKNQHGAADPESEKSHIATAGDPAVQREISTLQHQLLIAKQRTEEDFRQFEEHARHEAIVAARMKLTLAASMTLAFWLLGAVAFTYAERWSYGGAMWFCFIAMITIGYGDYHPSTQLGRAIFVIWGLMGVAVLTILLAVVQDAFGSIFHRLLTNSTSRLFDRAELRAKKRRLKEQQEEDEEDDIEAMTTSKPRNSHPRRRRHPHRKSEGDVRRQTPKPDDAAVPERKSMEACIERSALTGSPCPVEQETLDSTPTSPHISIPSFPLERTSSTGESLLTTQIQIPQHAAAKVEDTLVSTPQKVALAALQTFQHSVRVLQLNESIISQAMTDVPALRHYYNSRQPPKERSGPESKEIEKLDPETALQNLHASIRQTANPEYEKVAKLVVANLEFEHHLRILLDEFQGLKDRVEGFKQNQLERSRTLSLSEKPIVSLRKEEESMVRE